MKVGIQNLDVWFFMDDSDSIKKELLLFDKLLYETGPLHLVELLVKILPKGQDTFRQKMKDLEAFEKNGLIQKFDTSKITLTQDLLQNKEISENFNNYTSSYGKISGIGDRNKGKSIIDIYAEFMELDRTGGQFSSRFKSSVLNRIDTSNEYFPIIKKQTGTVPENYKANKQDVVHIVLKQFPLISNETSIEQIIEFKSDSDIKLRYYELMDFVTTVSKSNLTLKEIEEKIVFLLFQYKEGLKLHKLKYNSSTLGTICINAAQIIEDISKLKFSEVAKTIFEVNKTEIQLIEAERQLKGRELSYIVKIGDRI